MRINKVTLKNFKSFRGKHEIAFDDTFGLFAIKGDNLVDNIGSNGAGKSTVLDAIYYAFTGHTAQGLRGDNVKARDSKGSSGVRLLFHHDGTDHNLLRSRNPSHLTLDGKEIAQSTLDSLFNLTLTDMLRALIMDQFPEAFLLQTPAKRLEMFEATLGLAVWERAIKISRAKTKEIETEMHYVKGQIASNENFISGLDGERMMLAQKRDAFDEDKKAKVKELHEDEEKCKDARQKLAGLREQKLEALRKVESVKFEKGELERKKDVITTCMDDKMKAAEVAAAAGQELKGAEEIQASFDEHGKCPVCGTEASEYKGKSIKELQNASQKAEAAVAELSRKILAINEQYNEWNSKMEEQKKEQEEITSTLREIESDLDEQSNKADSLRQRREEEERRDNPYFDLYKEKEAAIEKTKGEVLAGQKKLKAQETDVDLHTYWEQGFKNLRLGTLEEALFALQTEANAIIHGLGLGSLRVVFSTERQTKQKTISKGFFVDIFEDEQQIAPGSFSGGEMQRINIALGMAFGSLMRNSHGFWPQQEFYDEPTANLSQEGTADLIAYLEQRARDNKIAIYLIDHKGPESLPTAFTVIKDSDGSRIQAV